MPRFQYNFQRDTDELSGRSIWRLELHDPRTGLTARAQVVVQELESMEPTFYGDYPKSVVREIRAMENSLVEQARDRDVRDTAQFKRPKYEEFERFMRIADDIAKITTDLKAAQEATPDKVLLLL